MDCERTDELRPWALRVGAKSEMMVRVRWLGFAFALLGGCGSESEPFVSSEDGPLYFITTTLITDTGITSAVAPVSDLNAVGAVDISTGLELGGRTVAVGPEGGGYLLVGSEEAPELTRYELREDGQLERGETLSFLNQGVVSVLAFSQNFFFESETKAYFLEPSQAQVIIFNPTEMAITNVIPMPELIRENSQIVFGMGPLRRGRDIVFVASYIEGPTFVSETRLVLFDTETDSVRRVTPDTRCSYLLHSAQLEDGDIYFASNLQSAVNEEVDGSGGPLCILRLPADAEVFDPSFSIDLRALTGGRPVGSMVQGVGSEVFLRVLDRGRAPEPANITIGGAYWRWARMDLSAPMSFEELSAEPGAGQVVQFDVDGRRLSSQSALDFSSSTLLDLSEPTLRGTLTIPGIPFSIVRVR